MSRETLSPSEKYIIDLFGQEDGDLHRVHQTLIQNKRFGVNVSAGEGKFLQFLVGATRAKLVVEIGTLLGYSTLWMAKALPTDGRLISFEKDEKTFAIARSNVEQSEVASKVELRCGDATLLLPKLSEEFRSKQIQPDLVFIDADKPNYKFYLDWAMTQVKVGGLIVGDNTFLFGHLIGEDRGESTSDRAIQSMRYFNETLAKSAAFRATMIPTYEGMTLAQRLY